MNQVIMRPKKPPRPKSEVFLDREDGPRRKRLSAFGGDSPYGRLDAYIKLEQLGEGSYATVFKGFSNLTKQVGADKHFGQKTNRLALKEMCNYFGPKFFVPASF